MALSANVAIGHLRCDRNLRFHAINWQCTASQLEVKPKSTGLNAVKSMVSGETQAIQRWCLSACLSRWG